MIKFDCEIKLIADYFQAKFSENAQASLKVKSGTKAKVEDDDSWKDLLYKDEKGIYVPAIQIKGALINGGKSIKKKPYGSFKDIVKAFLFIEPDRIYIGKQEPDFINESFPKRKDGLRVKLLHPAFNKGLTVSFKLNCTSEELDAKTIKMILEKGGLENGIGAWRPEHGRFEVTKFKKVK